VKPKKHPDSDLEKKRGLFIQIGLIAALAIVWIALEWRNYDSNAFDLGTLMMEDIEEEIIPITEREIKPPPPPPPVEELIIVEDEEELEEELEVEDMEVDEDTEIEIAEEEEDIDEDVIFQVVEQMPKFGNGDADLLNYLHKHIKYPQMALESGISGTVYLQFVVDKQGKVGEVQVLRGIGGGCDKEAVRVVKTMPDWAPGKQRGKPVSVYFHVPVHFNLR
jgi:protein TonB